MEKFQRDISLFNKSLCEQPRYVLLITKTDTFKIEQDLRSMFTSSGRSIIWFRKVFQEKRVWIDYFMLFGKKDEIQLGPIATQVSQEICARMVKKKFKGVKIVLVGLPYIVGKFFKDDWKLLSVDDFYKNVLNG